MSALHKLKAYFGMVPVDELDDYPADDYPADYDDETLREPGYDDFRCADPVRPADAAQSERSRPALGRDGFDYPRARTDYPHTEAYPRTEAPGRRPEPVGARVRSEDRAAGREDGWAERDADWRAAEPGYQPGPSAAPRRIVPAARLAGSASGAFGVPAARPGVPRQAGSAVAAGPAGAVVAGPAPGGAGHAPAGLGGSARVAGGLAGVDQPTVRGALAVDLAAQAEPGPADEPVVPMAAPRLGGPARPPSQFGGPQSGRSRSEAGSPPVTPQSTASTTTAEEHPLARITTLHLRSYMEARAIGEHYRDGTPVIINLTEMSDADAKRLVDFAAGLAFALHGAIDKVTNKVFLLSPPDVDVTAEDRQRLAQGNVAQGGSGHRS